MMPAMAGTKYVSAMDWGCAGAGVGVAAGSSTVKAVSECDGQYDSEPANVAYTVNLPEMSGSHS